MLVWPLGPPLLPRVGTVGLGRAGHLPPWWPFLLSLPVSHGGWGGVTGGRSAHHP